MKILQVIHGYPMRYNAGSEVYTQTLCRELVKRHQVNVFTRQEDAFAPDYTMRQEVDAEDQRVKLHIVNLPNGRDRYRHEGIDRRFEALLEAFNPEIVHIGHLNHLSTSLIEKAAVRSIPIVYTLHDYWLMCPRGQFMQMYPKDPNDLWAACSGQENRKCAKRCYARYFSGALNELENDTTYWMQWVERRMKHIHNMLEYVDLFIAPANYLFRRYRDEFGLPERKLVYLDYGFDLDRFRDRVRESCEPFTFGYIGTHIPAKGIHHLIEAFQTLSGNCGLRIWGRPRGNDTKALKALSEKISGLDGKSVEWVDEYQNQAIVPKVFNRVDALVVPSIWVENSPLVIHEALQAKVPVITANVGGMAEYVKHEINGLLFEHRVPQSLGRQMQRFLDHPEWANQLGQRGYFQSRTGDIISIQNHANAVEELYREVIERRESSKIKPLSGPWRITFDTNPDTCNLHCIMCEEHSPHSKLQTNRRTAGIPRRVMPIELMDRVVAEASQHGLREVIPSTMGEPLLYDQFNTIIKICSKSNVKLNLTTNGTFPRYGAAGWARRIVPVTSDIKISLNGATAETHEAIMKGAKWQDLIANTKRFVAERDAQANDKGIYCRVTFQITFLETNFSELADIVRLACRLGVDRVKGHHLWVHFPEIAGLSMRRSSDSIKRWNKAVDEALSVAEEGTLPNGKQVLLDNIFPLGAEATEDLAPGGICPFLGKEAWVSADGRFDPCSAPDAQRRSLGEFGNLYDRGIMSIWTGKAYRHLVETYRNRELCLGCNMRKPIDSVESVGA